jgi:hypothetical protein
MSTRTVGSGDQMFKMNSARPMKTLFLTSAHPGGSGVIGAGEAISESNLRALVSTGREVHVISFASPNQRSDPAIVGLCASYRTLENSRTQSVLGILHGLRWGSLLAPWFFTRVSPRNIRAVTMALQDKGIRHVWIDFPSSLGFAAFIRECEVEYFTHDVVSQKVGRRLLQSVLQPFVKETERLLMSFVRRCFVLSDKDGDLLRGIGFAGEIVVVKPENLKVGSVVDAIPISKVLDEFAGYKNLVFFGNMRRPENHWSIMHFLFFGYWKIRKAHPEVRLWVLGLAPRVTLRLLGRLIPGVRVVGAVDDPTPAFRAATLCVVPLRLGAGVKIKVLQMLDAGAKVVASMEGGEGIAANPNLLVVPYEAIPSLVCELLSNPGRDTAITEVRY